MMPTGRSAAFLLAALAACGSALPARALTVPPGFVVDNVVHGTSFDAPISIAFLPDHRMLVAEKRGVVWVVENGVRLPAPLWSAEDEVLDRDDRGLMSVAVDPDFTANRFVYFLYTVDPDGGADAGPYGFGRLTRYTVQPGEPPAVDPASRTVLMGADWTHGPLSAGRSHTVGHMRFGADGSLLVSVGDGAHYFDPDSGGRDPAAFGPGKTDPHEDIGAFRAQNVTSLCGKILRLNPATGHGYASNPFADGDLASVRSRVWAYGFRNPFRFEVRPGTGSADTSLADPGVLYVSDVGWETFEEIDVLSSGGRNSGWPCHEGPSPQAEYQSVMPAHTDCGSIGVSAENPAAASGPLIWWHHDTGALSHPAGWVGQTALAGAFYEGALYPAAHHGRFFYADFVRSYVRAMEVDASDAFVAASSFADLVQGPVCFTRDPANGDLLYVAIVASEVRRFRWTGAVNGNTPPVAIAASNTGTVAVGAPVGFSGAGSFDSDAEPVTHQWQFGDGAGAMGASAAHAFTAPGTYHAVLTVRDAAGAMGLDTVAVDVVVPASAPADPASRLALGPAVPNPARGRAAFTLALPAEARVQFSVHDLQGREIWSAPPAHHAAGAHVLAWPGLDRDGAPVRAGVYLARVAADGAHATRRFVLLR